jgi:hypothetical protein
MFDKPQDILGLKLFYPPTGPGGTSELSKMPLFSLQCLKSGTTTADAVWSTVLDVTAVTAKGPTAFVRQTGSYAACSTSDGHLLVRYDFPTLQYIILTRI